MNVIEAVFTRLAVGVAVLFFVSCGGKDEVSWLDLEIRQAGQELKRWELPSTRKVEGREDFETRFYWFPLSFITSMAPPRDSGGMPVDPFAAPSPIRKTELRTPKEILEGYGVSFPEGSEVKYDPDRMVLEVTNEIDELDLVDAIFSAIRCCGGAEVFHRLTIIELATDAAQVLERSSSQFFDHQAEWKSVRGWLRSGEASLVDSIVVVARSGTLVEFRSAGLKVDLDSVIGGDNKSIDYRIQVETEGRETMRLESEFSTGDDLVRLLGSWSAPGNPERCQLMFLFPSVQHIAIW